MRNKVKMSRFKVQNVWYEVVISVVTMMNNKVGIVRFKVVIVRNKVAIVRDRVEIIEK